MIEASINTVKHLNETVILSLHIPPELDYFRGHFPDVPVLPGVVQTHWAIHYGAYYLDTPTRIKRLEAIKFKHLIRPDMTVDLTLSVKSNGKMNYEYRFDHHIMSSGRIAFLEQ